ncbi:MAG: hypothetical protein LBU64_05795 [Planctomycetota bacterium]|jgi:hypothetical protein|nr:hypothetical protein [Planctomycetota bacterium]
MYQLLDPPALRKKYQVISRFLDERGRQVWAAVEAEALGEDAAAVSLVALVTGQSRRSIRENLDELRKCRPLAPGRRRRPGGGRKAKTQLYPNLPGELTALLDPVNRGDYDSPLRWTLKGLTELAKLLRQRGIRIGRQSVSRYLTDMGYVLQAHFRATEPVPDVSPGEQLERINDSAREALSRGEPVISLSARKIDPRGNPAETFPEGEEDGEGEIHGPVWDSPEAAELGNDDSALAAISGWWRREGSGSHPRAERILVTIDPVSGGGLGIDAWKEKLFRLARSLGLGLDARFFPPATYKWNLPLRRLAGGPARDRQGRLRPGRETVVGLLGAEPVQAIRP